MLSDQCIACECVDLCILSSVLLRRFALDLPQMACVKYVS